MQRTIHFRQGGRRLVLLNVVLAMTALFTVSAFAQGQPESPYYARLNTFGVLAAYSNDSSHILMGQADNRRLLSFGASYSRRLIRNGAVNWEYSAEVLPVALESDPVLHYLTTYTLPTPFVLQGEVRTTGPCRPESGSQTITQNGTVYQFTYDNTCSRQWNIGEAMSPVGFQWNFLPRHKLQPVFLAHGGYIYSTHPIPIDGAGSFNFTFDFGVGLELYRTKTRSIRADYRFHHISNRDTASQNPGIDNGLFQLTYSFGR